MDSTLSLVPFGVSSVCVLRNLFLPIVTSGLLIMDLFKAFDSVNHGLLLQIHKRSDPLLNCFSKYLIGRTQCVSVNKYKSAPLIGKMGVPQGSIPRPILFSIHK